ncbi:hypothetical protein NP233_g6649 [Leucocoprinus birnbaumii]|uniref:Uncharacterized protein n=1 Tax=Leucocoprinus birnbaumii TaxID=56174 RepID=A0AAD5YQR0_9AGAR|nr:hypothetical protein NP233_g6649 [Leucocoprinus birnbaumii]
MSNVYPFQNSRNLVFHNCYFKDEVHPSPKTHADYEYCAQQLLSMALLDAMHDSAAREELLHSIPRTLHVEFVGIFAAWARQMGTATPPIALLSGTRSNLAQLCAERLDEQLAATYFFSDPHYDNPSKFVPTIACQFAVQMPIYAELLGHIIRRNPAVLTKSLKVQFRELIYVPLNELKSRGVTVDNTSIVVVVDGFHGYKPAIRGEILRSVITAARDGLPLRWAFFGQGDMSPEGGLELMEEELFWKVDLSLSTLERTSDDFNMVDNTPSVESSAREVGGLWSTWGCYLARLMVGLSHTVLFHLGLMR